MSDGLNRAQRTAVTTTRGPLLVLAGAGTGKTRVITYRIAQLIEEGAKPSRILAVTFTNKAAREMRERATSLLKGKMPKKRRGRKKEGGPEISTFHSLCVRVLRRHAELLGYSENFTIYDRGDQESVAREALRDIRVGAQKLRPSDLINMISGWKGAGITAAQSSGAATTDAEVLGAMAYEKYQAKLRASSAMDFDDLLLLTVQLLDEHPSARFAEASRFDYLLIDEYQDTNGLQYQIVKALAERHRNLCVVGDDDQSIYGWRGAEVEHILGFEDQWKGCKVVRLEENYRSTAWVIHLANTLIKHNQTRHDKKLVPFKSKGQPPRFSRYEDENHEAEAIVADIFQRVNRTDDERIPASQIAILFRTNEQPRAFEQEMRRQGIPYILVGGQSFYDRKEIKDLISYLRVLVNPSDEVSLLRIINTPSRGIGTSSIQALLDTAVEKGDPLWRVLPEAEMHPDVTVGAANAVEGFVELIEEFRSRLGHEPLAPLIGEMINRIDYKSELARAYKDPGDQEARWNSVEEMVNAVAQYEEKADAPSLNGFLEESALSGKDDEKDDDRKEHAVTLMTLHSAKGLEFPIVYLVGLEEGMLPHKRSVVEGAMAKQIEEERRLAYVGVTRAQTLLTLSYCKGRMKWGKLRAQLPSRFLFEMRGESEKAAELAHLATEKITKEISEAAEALQRKEEKAKTKSKAGSKSKRRSSKASSDKKSRDAQQKPQPPAQARPRKPRITAPEAPEASVEAHRKLEGFAPAAKAPATPSSPVLSGSSPLPPMRGPETTQPATTPRPPASAAAPSTTRAVGAASRNRSATPASESDQRTPKRNSVQEAPSPRSGEPAASRQPSKPPSPGAAQGTANADLVDRPDDKMSNQYRQVGLFGE